MNANEAYKAWKGQHKVNMRVYTDEDMFKIGYEFRDAEVNDLIDVIEHLTKKTQEEKPKKAKVKKDD
jgi:hypothetical protein